MKIFVITLACVITYVTATCETKTADELQQLKCNADIVFRGTRNSGVSSTFSDGPYNFFYQRDTYSVITDYRDTIDGDTVTVFGIIPEQGPCPDFPIQHHDSLIFAKLNTTYNLYQIFPCSYNPDQSCVDLTAFNNIVC